VNSAFVTEEDQEGPHGLGMAIANSTNVALEDKSPAKMRQLPHAEAEAKE